MFYVDLCLYRFMFIFVLLVKTLKLRPISVGMERVIFKGKGHALCKFCQASFSVEHGGPTDINHHRETGKHK